ncbi:MAG: hypothetical protein QME74_07500, partial [Candidatus Edwardsbacteria bacterium]|nr:hypothetical protein [Candidatus Edwardsbacteria bacterium]
MTSIDRLSAKLDAVVQAAIVGFVGAMPVSIAFTQSALGIAWIAWLAKCLVEKKWRGFRTDLDLAIGLFFAACLAATVFSIHPLESLIGLKKFYLTSAVYLAAFNVRSLRRFQELLGLLVGMTALTGLYGIPYYFFAHQERLLSTQGMAMTSGGIYMMIALLALALAWRYWTQSLLRAASGGAAIVAVAALALTKTVSSYAGWLFGLITLLFSAKRAVVAVIVVVLSAGLLLLV